MRPRYPQKCQNNPTRGAEPAGLETYARCQEETVTTRAGINTTVKSLRTAAYFTSICCRQCGFEQTTMYALPGIGFDEATCNGRDRQHLLAPERTQQNKRPQISCTATHDCWSSTIGALYLKADRWACRQYVINLHKEVNSCVMRQRVTQNGF